MQRLQWRVDEIYQAYGKDSKRADEAIDNLNHQEVFTATLLPDCALRREIVRAWIRCKATPLPKPVEMVPVLLHAGGKCKITVLMTREDAEKQRED